MTTATAPRPVRTETVERFDPDGGLLEQVLAETAKNVDTIATTYAAAIRDPAIGNLERALVTARGIERLRRAITPDILNTAMSLMNSPLGFKTDRGKDKSPYKPEEVKECLVSALLHGFHWTGNEFNIISGQFYGAQAGYKRLLEEVSGISDIRISPGVPTVHNGQTVVRVALSWKLRGVPDQLIGPDGKPGQPFPIITSQYMSVDALIGKAKRKAYKMAFEKATGSALTVEDREVGEPSAEAAPAVAEAAEAHRTRTEEVAAKLGANGATDGRDGETPEDLLAADDEGGKLALQIAGEIEAAASEADLNSIGEALSMREEVLGAAHLTSLDEALRAKRAAMAKPGKRSK